MKKIYSQPEWKIVNFVAEDVITASTTNVKFDPDGLFDKAADDWDWN